MSIFVHVCYFNTNVALHFRNVLKINHPQRPEDIRVESLLQGPSYAPAYKSIYGGPVRGTSALEVLLERLERNERPSHQDVTQARREFNGMKARIADFEKNYKVS